MRCIWGLTLMRTITVCIGSSCHLKGSYDVINGLQELINKNGLKDEVEIKASFCLGECTKAVSVKVDDGPVVSVNRNTLESFFNEYIIQNKKDVTE